MEKKNIVWINTFKALCILAVYLVHLQSYYGIRLGNANLFFHTFYVNGFFFVSGYLLFWKQLTEPRILEDSGRFIKESGKTLFLNVIYRIVIPSIIFSFIEFIPSSLLHERRIDLSFALYKTIGGGTYWFTSALAVAELILMVLFCTRKRHIYFYVTTCFLLGIIGFFIAQMDILHVRFWAWKQGLLALILLGIGGLYWYYEKKIDKLMKYLIVMPILAIYVVMVVLFEDCTDPLISTLTIQPLGFATSILASILLVWLCKKLPGMKYLTFIGQNSIGFYFLSGALPITFSMFAHKLGAGNLIWVMLVIWITCVFGAYIVVMTINRWLPCIWDLRKINKQV